MDELPTRLSPDSAVAIVGAVQGRPWLDVTLGALAAFGAASLGFFAGGWIAGAVTACVVFPVVARLARRTRRWQLRVWMAHLDDAERARVVAAAWGEATPGQRAALQMILKKRA
jgi:hypothetical protein